jgi:predicted TIM-barrel fold metal-dependent hydrolase
MKSPRHTHLPSQPANPGLASGSGCPENNIKEGAADAQLALIDGAIEMPIRTFVDSHIHFWDLTKLYYDWLTDKIITDDVIGDYTGICNRNYLPDDFLKELRPGERALAVYIDCALGHKDPVEETQFVGTLAESHPWISAIVGRGDLTDPRFDELLERHMAASPLFRGIRMFCGPKVWNTSQFRRGLRFLRDRKLIFDLDADPETMTRAEEMAGVCEDLRIILGHAGFPKERTVEYFGHWRKAMKGLATHENVTCKVSGLGMIDHEWTEATIRPWVEGCLECFGTERCMFGSNWPVDSLYSSYDTLLNSYTNILRDSSPEDQQKFFYQNAVNHYSINVVPSVGQE